MKTGSQGRQYVPQCGEEKSLGALDQHALVRASRVATPCLNKATRHTNASAKEPKWEVRHRCEVSLIAGPSAHGSRNDAQGCSGKMSARPKLCTRSCIICVLDNCDNYSQILDVQAGESILDEVTPDCGKLSILC